MRLHVLGDARVALEIPVDELLRRAALDAELLREAERAHAVDEPEVDGLDVAALVGGHLGGVTPKISPAVARWMSSPAQERADAAPGRPTGAP